MEQYYLISQSDVDQLQSMTYDDARYVLDTGLHKTTAVPADILHDDVPDTNSDIDQQITEIKARLVLARKRAGLSQGQAAKLVGMNAASSLSQHENDRSIPTLELFLRLCKVYGVSPVWALTGINPDFDATEILRSASGASKDIMQIVDLLSSLGNKGVVTK